MTEYYNSDSNIANNDSNNSNNFSYRYGAEA